MGDSALARVLAEIELHVGWSGWDQPARLFALVDDAVLAAADPGLGLAPDPAGGSLSAVETDGFRPGEDLAETLAGIGWSDRVAGCALAVERAFLPAQHESEVPETGAAEFVARHPGRLDLRLVVGVLRGGERHCLARLASQPEELLGAQDMAPGLAMALLSTLAPTADPMESETR